LIRTIARKGVRFVGIVDTSSNGVEPTHYAATLDELNEQPRPAMPLPDRPAIAVLPFTNMSGDPVIPSRSIFPTASARISSLRYREYCWTRLAMRKQRLFVESREAPETNCDADHAHGAADRGGEPTLFADVEYRDITSEALLRQSSLKRK
jgi:hypothetical protein